MENIFESKVVSSYISRINRLSAETKPKWGKMGADQMLAHLNVTYELVYEPQKHKKAGAIAKFFLKKFVKPKVTGEASYPKNSPTSPMFRIEGKRDFQQEKRRLIGFLQKTQQLGAEAFHGKESHSFGKLTSEKWSNLFTKHLDHHLEQFGV